MNRIHLVRPTRRTRRKPAGPLRPQPESVRWSGMAPNDRLQVEYMYRAEDGTVKHRVREWVRPATKQAITEWIDEYLERVADGYMPEGFTVAPIPHCARVLLNSRVVAEWITPRRHRSAG